jgi:low temperature requirement A protein (LtrA)
MAANERRGDTYGRSSVGAPGWNRTNDTRFRRAVLYPLSYWGTTERRTTLSGMLAAVTDAGEATTTIPIVDTTPSPPPGNDADVAAAGDARVSNFELFFDLVFVFALTRVTELVARDASWTSLGRSVLIFAVLWWAWGAYAWLTNAMPTDRPVPRLVVLAAMAAMLVVALAVPSAFGDSSVAFALAYLVVMLLHDILFAVAADDLAKARPAIMRLGATNLAGALLLLGAGFSSEPASPTAASRRRCGWRPSPSPTPARTSPAWPGSRPARATSPSATA